MKHEISIISGHVFEPPLYLTKRLERWWSCTCGRVGPGIVDKQRSDDSILRGGRSHRTRALKRGKR